MLMNPGDLIPVSLLTGFLGSGKTTLLNKLLRQPGLQRTLVLINEFGEIGLDHALVSHSSEDVVVEMASGCLCCTIRGDLARTLREAPSRFSRNGRCWFDRVIIETTGLADPAPILHTLMTEASVTHRYRLDAVFTTVDAVNGLDTLDRHNEAVRQAAIADHLLLTKSDIADKETLDSLERRLESLNPAAPRTSVINGHMDAWVLLNSGLYDPDTRMPDVARWLGAEDHEHRHSHGHGHGHGHGHDVNRHSHDIRALSIRIEKPIRGVTLDLWLETLLSFRGPDFLRIKGLINLVELKAPIVIHGVQHIFHPPIVLEEWPDDDQTSRIVFITRGIEESLLRNTLRILTEASSDSTGPDQWTFGGLTGRPQPDEAWNQNRGMTDH
ncbi:MAG: GTP-binding protein [Chromatiales bacterium]|nr:GTP-binding protein [Chromatiales bacterium]